MKLMASIGVLLLAACGGSSVGPTPSAEQRVPSASWKAGGASSSSCSGSPCIYVTCTWNGGNQRNKVVVFPIGATGDVAPVAVIKGAQTRLLNPRGVAVAADHSVYTAEGDFDGEIDAYSPNEYGNAPPVQSIYGDKTDLTYATGVALDGDGRIYVANGASMPYNARIIVFSRTADGDVSPKRTIAGRNTGFFFQQPFGIAVTQRGKIYVVTLVNGGGSIEVFPPGANGNVAPSRTISGPATGLNYTDGIALDNSGNMYVASAYNVITEYAANANGDAAPIKTIEGPKTKLVGTQGIALDSNDNIYVANVNTSDRAVSAVNVYAAGASGNVAPIRLIKGQKTAINDCIVQGIAVR